MTSTDSRIRPASELWQQSTTKWQQSTSDMWRRSTLRWYDSKDKCHQTTMELWHRSADSITNGKEKAQRSTVDAWNRSADTWTSSKNRYLQSTADRLIRSANALASREQLARPAIKSDEEKSDKDQEPAAPTVPERTPTPQPSPPSNPSETSNHNPPVSPESTVSPESFKSPSSLHSEPSAPSLPSLVSPPAGKLRKRALSESVVSSVSSCPPLINLAITKKKAPDHNTTQLIELVDTVTDQLKQAARLRGSRPGRFGEIEHNWINSTIVDAEDSSREMDKILTTYRAVLAKRKGKLNHSSRKRWREKDCQLAREKYPRLILHQTRLEKVLGHLSSVAISVQIPSKKPFEELAAETPIRPFPELPAEDEIKDLSTQRASELSNEDEIKELPNDTEALPAIVELPTTSAPTKTFVAELPGSTYFIKRKPMQIVPKIIVTQVVEDLSSDQRESREAEEPNYEDKEMDQMMAWEKTRNDIQMQQSASLARIVAEMENNKITSENDA